MVYESSHTNKQAYLHVNVRGLESALVNVVMRKCLGGVGTVFVHRHCHFALRGNTMSHPSFL